ncbi:hypothetical protein HRbin12_01524 [bacterium HR12]|nr:hypothetical protein HRbin12_01524 [bacterium HR12]
MSVAASASLRRGSISRRGDRSLWFRLMFLGFPIWWALGIGAFIWPILALPLTFSLLRRSALRIPRGFWLWLLFLLWVVGSASQLDEGIRGMTWGYRAVSYFAATILFLYLYNEPRDRLSDRRVLLTLLVFWVYVTLGGLLGVIAPRFEFESPLEHVLPGRLASNEFVHALVHPAAAQISTFLGYEAPRPKAPFEYTNDWGSAFALTTPLAIAAFPYVQRGGQRLAVLAMLLISIVPVVLSLNRGLLLSLGAALLYALVRTAANGRHRPALGIGFGLAIVVIFAIASPLRDVIEARFQTPHSNQRREALYVETLSGALRSPILGFGAPRPSEANPNMPSVGTQGQLWLVLYSQGIPGALFYVGWHLVGYLRTLRRSSWTGFWCNVVALIALLQLPYYGHIAAQLQVIMVALALGLRSTLERTHSPSPREGLG